MTKEKRRLQNAYNYLVSTGVVESFQDVGQRMGYNKSTVSVNIKGDRKASPVFIKRFEKAFELDLVNYNEAMPVIKHEVSKFEEQTFVFKSLIELQVTMDEILQMLCHYNPEQIAAAKARIDGRVLDTLSGVNGG